MKEKIKVLQIIHFALLAGLTIAYFILGDLFNLSMPKLEGENMYYIFIPAIAILISNFLFKNGISKIDSNKSNKEKIIAYQSVSIISWSVLEFAAFIILILKPTLIVFGLLILLYFLMIRPTKEKIENELNIKL